MVAMPDLHPFFGKMPVFIKLGISLSNYALFLLVGGQVNNVARDEGFHLDGSGC